MQALIRVVPFLIAVLVCYLAYIFLSSVSPTSRIAVIERSVHQIYTCGQCTSCCITPLLVVIIVLAFSKILTKKLSGFTYQGGLTFSRLGLVFLISRFGKFFFLVKPSIFPTISIYFSNASWWLERSFRFVFNSAIDYFVPEV